MLIYTVWARAHVVCSVWTQTLLCVHAWARGPRPPRLLCTQARWSHPLLLIRVSGRYTSERSGPAASALPREKNKTSSSGAEPQVGGVGVLPLLPSLPGKLDSAPSCTPISTAETPDTFVFGRRRSRERRSGVGPLAF